MDLLLSAAAAFCYTLGGVFMQNSEGLTKFAPSLLIYLCFIAGATLHTIAVRVANSMGITYILILGLEAVLAVLFSILLLKEEGYSFLKLIGIVLVVVGVALLRAKTAAQ
ncbi:small multidrug resistance protein [Cyanobacteria bacterium FACHB-471]|nr:small multidrug resistance protein [Cyanobacteria bacterium FACHB-471]